GYLALTGKVKYLISFYTHRVGKQLKSRDTLINKLSNISCHELALCGGLTECNPDTLDRSPRNGSNIANHLKRLKSIISRQTKALKHVLRFSQIPKLERCPGGEFFKALKVTRTLFNRTIEDVH